jgi:hypothetical protein
MDTLTARMPNPAVIIPEAWRRTDTGRGHRKS